MGHNPGFIKYFLSLLEPVLINKNELKYKRRILFEDLKKKKMK